MNPEEFEIFILKHGLNAIKIVGNVMVQMKINALAVLNNHYQTITFLQEDAVISIGIFYLQII